MELFLIAHIAGRGVAIPAEQVGSVVDIGDVVAVPQAEAAIRGLTALRSRVVTVIDTGTALGLAPTPETARRAVITQVDGHDHAILVDLARGCRAVRAAAAVVGAGAQPRLGGGGVGAGRSRWRADAGARPGRGGAVVLARARRLNGGQLTRA
ncbi:chemotaxis protein CheW [Sphingomonas aerolata]|uniref:chemotaxis protein CheW n=1 Tax=Sphingomonas aerolata TaxID=185951 RepID=UPI002FE10552